MEHAALQIRNADIRGAEQGIGTSGVEEGPLAGGHTHHIAEAGGRILRHHHLAGVDIIPLHLRNHIAAVFVVTHAADDGHRDASVDLRQVNAGIGGTAAHRPGNTGDVGQHTPFRVTINGLHDIAEYIARNGNAPALAGHKIIHGHTEHRRDFRQQGDLGIAQTGFPFTDCLIADIQRFCQGGLSYPTFFTQRHNGGAKQFRIHANTSFANDIFIIPPVFQKVNLRIRYSIRRI